MNFSCDDLDCDPDLDQNITNITNVTQAVIYYPSTVLSVFTQLSYVLVFLIGLTGNTLVIYVVLRYSKMQTVTNMYILNLALADECFIFGIPFLLTTSFLQYWPFNTLICKAYMTTSCINQFTTCFFVMVMSADRYVAVCHPVTATELRTPVIARIVSFGVWIVSALLMIPIIMYTNISELGPNNQPHCNIMWPDPSTGMNIHVVVTLYSFTAGFALPVLVILVLYFLVLQKLKTIGPKNKSKERKRSNRKVTKLVLTVIAIYIFCWTPYWVIQLMLIIGEPNESLPEPNMWLNFMAFSLSYWSSAVNPILYAFLSEDFKRSFTKACVCESRQSVNAMLQGEHSNISRRGISGSVRLLPSSKDNKSFEYRMQRGSKRRHSKVPEETHL